jgi:hypothetical protein
LELGNPFVEVLLLTKIGVDRFFQIFILKNQIGFGLAKPGSGSGFRKISGSGSGFR